MNLKSGSLEEKHKPLAQLTKRKRSDQNTVFH